MPERARLATLPCGSTKLAQLALIRPVPASFLLPLLIPLPSLARRSVLKLVYCAQQERGVTCGWVAGCGSLDYFGSRLGERRADTDATLTKEVKLTFPWMAPELAQLRSEVDLAVDHHRHLADASASAEAAEADEADEADAPPAAEAVDNERREQLKGQLQQRPPLPATPTAAPVSESYEWEPPASAPAPPHV